MKKYLILLFIFLSSLTVYSCKNCGCRADKNKTAEHKHENDSHSHAKIDISKSKVKWKGAKIGGSHEGTINIISAHLHFNDREFEGGDVIIDMKSMTDYPPELYNEILKDWNFRYGKFNPIPYPNYKQSQSNSQEETNND